MTVIIIIYNIFPPAEKKSHKFTKKKGKKLDFVIMILCLCVYGESKRNNYE